jgi:subfamily B ATP-binding cassette protein MsbA
MYRRVLGYSRPYAGWILLSMAASIVVGGMDGAFAWFVEPVLQRIFASRDLTLFALLPLGVILIFVLRGVGRFVNEYFIRVAGELAIQDIRASLFDKLLSLSLRLF